MTPGPNESPPSSRNTANATSGGWPSLVAPGGRNRCAVRIASVMGAERLRESRNASSCLRSDRARARCLSRDARSFASAVRLSKAARRDGLNAMSRSSCHDLAQRDLREPVARRGEERLPLLLRRFGVLREDVDDVPELSTPVSSRWSAWAARPRVASVATAWVALAAKSVRTSEARADRQRSVRVCIALGRLRSPVDVRREDSTVTLDRSL